MLHRQAKAKRMQRQQTSFSRKVKGTSLSEKEKAKARNINYERKKLISKGKHTVKVGNHLTHKLEGGLKDKSSKIIYIHNKQLRDIQNN